MGTRYVATGINPSTGRVVQIIVRAGDRAGAARFASNVGLRQVMIEAADVRPRFVPAPPGGPGAGR